MNRRNLWFVVVPVMLFTILAVCIHADIATHFEGWAYSETVEHMSPLLTSFMKGVTQIGNPASVMIFCLGIFLIPKLRKTIALPVSTAVILSTVADVALKRTFARSRPNILRLISEVGYSFPSGHAMVNASFYVMLILMAFRYMKDLRKKIAFSCLCAVLIGLIGLSRIYLGVHYAGDVLGGWLFGFAISVLVYLLWMNRQPSRSALSFPTIGRDRRKKIQYKMLQKKK